jgi:hypothetical protein
MDSVTCAPSPASRSQGCSLWRTPVTIVTRTCALSVSPGLHHFPDYLPYICHSLWFLPQEWLFLFLCQFCALVMFLIFVLCCVYLLKHSLPELASWLSAHIITNRWFQKCVIWPSSHVINKLAVCPMYSASIPRWLNVISLKWCGNYAESTTVCPVGWHDPLSSDGKLGWQIIQSTQPNSQFLYQVSTPHTGTCCCAKQAHSCNG